MRTVSQIRRNPKKHWVGDGFPVRTVFSYSNTDFSPFLLLDFAGPHVFEPTQKRRGVGKHPHRGFETVSIVFAGEVEHHDSSGAGGQIGPGDVQWMTAASGVIHEEYHGKEYALRGGPFEMIQLWVNLPKKDKMNAPRYQSISASEIPHVDFPDHAGHARVIAGSYGSVTGPALTHSPVSLWDVHLRANSSVQLPAPRAHNAGVFLIQGALQIRSSSGATPLEPADLSVFAHDGDTIDLRADADSHFLVLAGEPLGEPIVGYGPFVMNTEQEILQAIRDYGF